MLGVKKFASSLRKSRKRALIEIMNNSKLAINDTHNLPTVGTVYEEPDIKYFENCQIY